MGNLVLAFLLACLTASSAFAQQPLGIASTYRYAGGPITTLAANPTDWLTVTGSATKTVTINKLSICGTATSAATLDVLLLKRSTADSGGTSTATTALNVLANNINPTSTVAVYTVNPTLGTAVAQIDAKKLNAGPPTGNAGCINLDYGYPIAILGVGQQLAINLNGATMPSNISLDYMIEVTER